MSKDEKDNFLGAIPEVQGLLQFMENRGVEITTVLVLVLLILGGSMGYRNWSQRRIEDASLRFANAQSVQDLDDLAADFPKLPLSAAALLRSAKWHYEQGGYEQAMRRYEDFLQRFSEHPFTPAAELGLLQCQEAIGMVDAALAGYQRFIDTNPGHFLLPQAQLSLARVLERTGRQQEAVDVYEKMAANYSGTGWEDFAIERLELFELQANQPLAAAARPIIGVPEMQMPQMPEITSPGPASDTPMEPLISLNADQLRLLQEEAHKAEQTEQTEPPAVIVPEAIIPVPESLPVVEDAVLDDTVEDDQAVDELDDAAETADGEKPRRRGLVRRRSE